MKLNARKTWYLLSATIIFLLLAVGTSSAQDSCPLPAATGDCVVTLKGTANVSVSPECSSAPFAVAVVPVPVAGPGSFYQACVQVTINPNVKISVETRYDGTPVGWSFHIADSFTNNGFGGDAGTQTNDSEAQVLGETLTVYANDNGPGDPIHQIVFPSLHNQKVCYEARDQFIGWRKADWTGSSSTPNPTHMPFAFAGEPDPEGGGTADNFVWICGNRVINGTSPTSRVGRGLQEMRIRVGP